MKSQIYTLEQSKDYNRFKFFNSNRPIKARLVNELSESIKKYGLLCPIIVSKDFYILEGQHRYHALKGRRDPITFIVNHTATRTNIKEINSVRFGWDLLDFLNYECQEGNSNYIELNKIYLKYKKDFKLSLGAVSEIYTDQSNVSTHIKKGSFKINKEFGFMFFEYLLQLENFFSRNLETRFIQAFKRVIISNPNFNISVFTKKLKSKKLYNYSTIRETYDAIVEIYNWKNKNKIK